MKSVALGIVGVWSLAIAGAPSTASASACPKDDKKPSVVCPKDDTKPSAIDGCPDDDTKKPTVLIACPGDDQKPTVA